MITISENIMVIRVFGLNKYYIITNLKPFFMEYEYPFCKKEIAASGRHRSLSMWMTSDPVEIDLMTWFSQQSLS